MRFFGLIAIFITLSYSSFAQKGKIEGKITDSKSGSPIAGISVINKVTGKGIATDLEGRFLLNAEIGKKYILGQRQRLVNFRTCVQIGAFFSRVPGSPPTVRRNCGLIP